MELQKAFKFFADQVVSAREDGRELADIEADSTDEGGIMVCALDTNGDAMASVGLDGTATDKDLRNLGMVFFATAAFSCGLKSVMAEAGI